MGPVLLPCPLAGNLALLMGLTGPTCWAGPRQGLYRDSAVRWLTQARRLTNMLTQGAGLYRPQASLARLGGRRKETGGGDSQQPDRGSV